MALLLSPSLNNSVSPCYALLNFGGHWKLKKPRIIANPFYLSSTSPWLKRRRNTEGLGNSNQTDCRLKAFFFNPTDEPVLKQALKEPVAFVGGVFAGLLRLDLDEDPLKEWVTRTVEAAGISEEEIDAQGLKPEEDIPQQIEID